MGWHVYTHSLGAGALRSVLGVRSPAAPVVAPSGLLARLAGEMLAGHLPGCLFAQGAAANRLHSKTFAAPSGTARDAETPS